MVHATVGIHALTGSLAPGLPGSHGPSRRATVWPFLFVLIAALLAMVLLPETVLWLPREFGYK